MPDRYDFEQRGRNLVSMLGTLTALCCSGENRPSADDLAGTFALLRDQTERLYEEGMAFAFPQP